MAKQLYIAFDIETARIVPGPDFDWKPHRPLGITCIASMRSDETDPRVWLSRDEFGNPAPRMTREDVAEFISYLNSGLNNSIVPVSWNGLSFDLDVLAEESGMLSECRSIARSHIDMMFHVVCEKGFPVSLQSAATGLGVDGKLAGVEGIDAPQLWANGQHSQVMDYVAQDVRTTMAVFLKAASKKKFTWTTRKGTLSSMPLTSGWLPVDQAADLPEPDTSWMANPPSRADFQSWL